MRTKLQSVEMQQIPPPYKRTFMLWRGRREEGGGVLSSLSISIEEPSSEKEATRVRPRMKFGKNPWLAAGCHFCIMFRGGILGVRCGDIFLISSSTLPGLGRVSAKNINKLTDFNPAVSSPDHVSSSWEQPVLYRLIHTLWGVHSVVIFCRAFWHVPPAVGLILQLLCTPMVNRTSERKQNKTSQLDATVYMQSLQWAVDVKPCQLPLALVILGRHHRIG